MFGSKFLLIVSENVDFPHSSSPLITKVKVAFIPHRPGPGFMDELPAGNGEKYHQT